jgi:hypothetical protein
MCVYSMIADYYRDRLNTYIGIGGFDFQPPLYPQFTTEEVEALKKLIKQAIKTDNVFKDCDCETPEKVDWLKSVGIDIADLHEEVKTEQKCEWDGNHFYDETGKTVGKIFFEPVEWKYIAMVYGEQFASNTPPYWAQLGEYKTNDTAKSAIETWWAK